MAHDVVFAEYDGRVDEKERRMDKLFSLAPGDSANTLDWIGTGRVCGAEVGGGGG